MSITIVVQSDGEAPFERCCFCRTRSKTWCPEKDVPVCAGCAESRDPADVPSKAAWCAAEDAIRTAGFRIIGSRDTATSAPRPPGC